MPTPFDSPALSMRSILYPIGWNGRVPKRIRMNKTVRSDVPTGERPHRPIAMAGTEFGALVNSNGAVSAIFESGETLGLQRGDFTIIEWHEGVMANGR